MCSEWMCSEWTAEEKRKAAIEMGGRIVKSDLVGLGVEKVSGGLGEWRREVEKTATREQCRKKELKQQSRTSIDAS